jgi:histidinol dehydrogenase
VTTAATGSEAPWSVYRWSEIDAESRRRVLERSNRQIFDSSLRAGVEKIVADVREHGDIAVSRALARFDHCEVAPGDLQVAPDEIAQAGTRLPESLKAAIRFGMENIRRFNERLMAEREWREEIAPGVVVGERLTPIDRIGLFVPSGKASYPSVLMHLGTPAVVAGVPELAIVVPPVPGGAGELDPAVLFVAHELGISRVFRANGVAGIAALAFGTETFPKVRMVVGPGSPAVAAAQVIVQLYGTKTNMLMGPSESLIIADEHANAEWLASDLLNEAEHGPDSASLLVTASRELVQDLEGITMRRLAELPEPRQAWARGALTKFGGVILVDDLDEAVSVANEYAPEHMIVDVARPEALIPRLTAVGEILIGPWTPISAANFAIGVPAALPTGGYAKLSGGITARSFTKATSIAQLNEAGLESMTECVLELARHEGFPAHAASFLARQGG